MIEKIESEDRLALVQNREYFKLHSGAREALLIRLTMKLKEHVMKICPTSLKK